MCTGFKNINDHDTYDVDGTRMFRIRGTCPDDVRATQVPEVAPSLCSGDSFVLDTPGNVWIWIGSGTTDEEKEFAEAMAGFVAPGKDAKSIR